MDFLSIWVSFVCYVYSSALVWCFISMKHAKRQHTVAIKAWITISLVWPDPEFTQGTIDCSIHPCVNTASDIAPCVNSGSGHVRLKIV